MRDLKIAGLRAVNPGATFESLGETFERFANRIVEITKTNARARFGICLGVDACSPRVELQTR